MLSSIYKKTGENAELIAIIHRGKSISYKQLEININKMTALLISLGLQRNDRIMLALPNCPEFIYTLFGAWALGVNVIPVDFRLRATEYKMLLSEAEPKIVVTSEDASSVPAADIIRDAIREGNNREIIVLTTENELKHMIEYAAEEELSNQYAAQDFDAVIQYTSGTMGKPKGVIKRAEAFLLEAKSFAKRMEYGPRDVILVVIPLYHAYAFGDALISGLISGTTLVLEERFTGREQLKSMEEYGVTIFPAVPFMISMLHQLKDTDKYDVSKLRTCFYAGAPLREKDNLEFKKRFNIVVYPLFGSSETNTICVNTELDKNGLYNSVGTPIDGVEILIKDEEGKLLPNGETGDIWVRSQIAGYGYIKNEELTSSTFVDGCVLTGDVGYLNEEGMLFITGRKKNFINVGGEKVDPAEIENVIRMHPNVKDCVVVGIADAMGGQVVKAVVVPAPHKELSRRDIIEQCKIHMVSFKVPRIVEFLNALPMNATGKVMRKSII